MLFSMREVVPECGEQQERHCEAGRVGDEQPGGAHGIALSGRHREDRAENGTDTRRPSSAKGRADDEVTMSPTRCFL